MKAVGNVASDTSSRPLISARLRAAVGSISLTLRYIDLMGGSFSLVINVLPAGVWFLSLAMISAGGTPASGMLDSSILVLMLIVLCCWVVELSMVGKVAQAG